MLNSLNFGYSIAMLILLFSCNQIQEKQKIKKPRPLNTKELLKQYTQQWNDALDQKNLDNLSEMYGAQVTHYGRSKTKQQVIEMKKQYFDKHPDFTQGITLIKIEQLAQNSYKSSFVKVSGAMENQNRVDGYLVFTKTGDDWKIITEGDLTTDHNLKNRYKRTLNAKAKISGKLTALEYTIAPGTFTALIIELNHPITVIIPDDAPDSPIEGKEDKNISKIQIHCIEDDLYDKLEDLIGQKIEVQGTLFFGMTHYYRAKYAISVKTSKDIRVK